LIGGGGRFEREREGEEREKVVGVCF